MSTEPRRYADDIDLDQIPEERRPVEPDYDYPDPEPVRREAEIGERPSRIPDGVRRPQDRRPAAAEAEQDSLEPVMNEALGILVVKCHHDGMELELPADPEDWPIKATRAFEQGKVIMAVENILSTEDFNKVLKKNYRNKEFGKLYEKLAKAGGFDNSGN